MRRRLLNVLTALSLLLFVAVVALWARSYWVAYSWNNSSESRELVVWSETGRIFVQHTTPVKRLPPSEPAASPLDFRGMFRRLEAYHKLEESKRRVPLEAKESRRFIRSRSAVSSSVLANRHRKQAASYPGTISSRSFWGFHWFISNGGKISTDSASERIYPARWRAAIPLWPVALVFSLLPLGRARSYLKTHRRERRLLLNTLATLSLLLSVAAVALGVRSYWVVDEWYELTEDRILFVWSEAGRIFALHKPMRELPPLSDLAKLPPTIRRSVIRNVTEYQPMERQRQFISKPAADPLTMTERLRQDAASDPGMVRDWHFLGFHWFVTEGSVRPYGGGAFTKRPYQRIGIPLWSVALVFSLLPLGRAKSYIKACRREHRRHMGFCENCGYDLRASPECCPECGAISPQPAAPVQLGS